MSSRAREFFYNQATEQGLALKGVWPTHSVDTLSLKCPLCSSLVEIQDREAHIDWHTLLFKMTTVSMGGQV